eukprot:scaffold174351_cov29-Tisochrysis_lutea.AAC.2
MEVGEPHKQVTRSRAGEAAHGGSGKFHIGSGEGSTAANYGMDYCMASLHRLNSTRVQAVPGEADSAMPWGHERVHHRRG